MGAEVGKRESLETNLETNRGSGQRHLRQPSRGATESNHATRGRDGGGWVLASSASEMGRGPRSQDLVEWVPHREKRRSARRSMWRLMRRTGCIDPLQKLEILVRASFTRTTRDNNRSPLLLSRFGGFVYQSIAYISSAREEDTDACVSSKHAPPCIYVIKLTL